METFPCKGTRFPYTGFQASDLTPSSHFDVLSVYVTSQHIDIQLPDTEHEHRFG